MKCFFSFLLSYYCPKLSLAEFMAAEGSRPDKQQDIKPVFHSSSKSVKNVSVTPTQTPGDSSQKQDDQDEDVDEDVTHK